MKTQYNFSLNFFFFSVLMFMDSELFYFLYSFLVVKLNCINPKACLIMKIIQFNINLLKV